jgi:hypothetical protein
MPYKLVEQSGRYCVQKEGGEVLKCYDDKGGATKYLRALYANVHEGVSELSMYVVKANIKDGEMRLRMTSSDTGKDAYEEAMSTELFDDFLSHIRDEDEIPEAFKSVIAEETWDGGMPYVSIAHYKSGKDGVNVPGVVKSIYRDGKVLKATAVLYDTPLGRAVFKSLQKDLVEKRDDKVRVSIGFLDLSHSHGDKYTFVRKALGDKCPLCKEGVGDKIYKKGHLVHLALTRVPANPRTDVEVEKSMTTKREDAESIIEDEEVVKGLDLKSQAEDVLVIKSDETPVPEAPVQENTENTVVSPAPEVVTITPAPIYEPTPVEKSFAVLKSKIEAIKSQGLVGEAALAAIQPDFDQIGEVIKSEFTPKPSPEAEAQKSLETTLRSLLNEMLPQILGQTVAPIQSQIETLQGELRAKSLTVPTKKEEIQTVQRSLTPTLVQKAAVEKLTKKSVSQFDLIAQQSVGLQ